MSTNRKHVSTANRLNLALDDIDEAQSLVEQAAQALAAVDRMRRDRERLACLSHRLAWTWIGLRAAANRRRRRSCPATDGK